MKIGEIEQREKLIGYWYSVCYKKEKDSEESYLTKNIDNARIMSLLIQIKEKLK